ncbi:MAG: universal stress protein [Desulfobacterales bacterium]
MAIEHIVCCTDFSENALTAFDMALEMAEKYRARLTVLHVVPVPTNPLMVESEWVFPDRPNEAITLKIQKRMEEDYAGRIPAHITHSLVIRDGHVSSEILQYLQENQVDLVVVGSYGLTGMELVVFGSVAKRIAHKAPCSVLVARHSRQ